MKLFFGKRGIEKEGLVLLISVVALLLFYLLTVLKGASNAAESSADLAACKGSVIRNAQLRINGLEFPTDIRCPARNVLIKEKESDKANDLIAKEMYYCWDQYGEGKLNLFTDESTYCAICSFIHVDTNQPVTGLQDYLTQTQIPDKSGRLYSDYLAGFQTTRAEAVLGAIKNEPVVEKNMQSSLPGKNDYAVIFVYAKGNDQIRRVINHLTLSTAESKVGLAYGAFAGLGAGTAAGGAVATGLMVAGAVGLAAGPPGWVVIGAGAAIGIAGGALTGWVISFFASPKVPEWAAFTVLREWNGADTAKILTDGLGCESLPVQLE